MKDENAFSLVCDFSKTVLRKRSRVGSCKMGRVDLVFRRGKFGLLNKTLLTRVFCKNP